MSQVRKSKPNERTKKAASKPQAKKAALSRKKKKSRKLNQLIKSITFKKKDENPVL